MSRCFTISAILVLLLIEVGNSQNTSSMLFDRQYTQTGELGLSISNTGTIGRPNVSIHPEGVPSMEYPKDSGTEHLFEAGIWLGAIVDGQVRVSTSSITSPSGYSIRAEGFEFTNEGDVIERIEKSAGDAVSDEDLKTVFTDRFTHINDEPIPGHEFPLFADVELTVYSWEPEEYGNFKILEYEITNNGNSRWNDFYFGSYSDLVVRNVLTTTEVGSAFFNKKGLGYLYEYYTIYSFDAGSTDDPSVNTYASISIAGSKYRGNYFHPLNHEYLESQGVSVPLIRPSFWKFSGGSESLDRPNDDSDRYERLSTNFPLEDYRNQLRTDGLEGNGMYQQLLSIGAFPEIDPGESITVYLVFTAALKPEEYQGLSGKAVDTEDSRLLLTETLARAFEVVTGQDPNNWDDMFDVPASVSVENFTTLPKNFELRQNYPNPFNPITQIRFGLPQSADVRLEVYNLIGQRVAFLVNEHRPAGWHDIPFDASNLSSGIYLYRLHTDSFVQTRKMMHVK